MSELRDLYQEMILDHGKRPRNFRALVDGSAQAEGYNPLCGDRVTVYVAEDGGRVAQAAFQGAGCAISTASASMMTEAVRGKTRDEVRRLFERFHGLVTRGEEALLDGDAEALGKLAVFAGVSEFPMRVKCATLAWHTLSSALEGSGEPVSTE